MKRIKVKTACILAVGLALQSGALFAADRNTTLTSAAQAPQPPAPAQTSDESPNDLFVTVGKSVVVNSSQPIERVALGFGDFAEAQAVSPQEVLVSGKAPGETSLIVWQRGGARLFFDVTVQASRAATNSKLDGVRREIARELNGQPVTISYENDTVFLRGQVHDLNSVQRASAIAGSLGKVVNLLYVDAPAAAPQILLKVKFAAVDRNLSRQLGINLFSTGATNTVGSVTTGQFSPPQAPTLNTISPSTSRGITTSTTLASALNLFFFRPDLNLGAAIEALETQGVLETLAEPNVLAENGRQASFLAGGEFPFPSVQGGSAGTAPVITIQFREFGVRLNFIPTIMPNGTIRLQVAPEVSALDFTNGLSLNGFNIPALTVRKVNTEVELNEGQSFAIGGLLDNRVSDTLEKVPFLGDIPILGNFFKSRARTKQNTELIVIVTPELVRPIAAGKPLPALHYPVPFLSKNTDMPMSTPEMSVTGPVPLPPTPGIPAEELLQSLEPERPLVVSGASGNAVAAPPANTAPTAPVQTK